MHRLLQWQRAPAKHHIAGSSPADRFLTQPARFGRSHANLRFRSSCGSTAQRCQARSLTVTVLPEVCVSSLWMVSSSSQRRWRLQKCVAPMKTHVFPLAPDLCWKRQGGGVKLENWLSITWTRGPCAVFQWCSVIYLFVWLRSELSFSTDKLSQILRKVDFPNS